jgi:hypothetical protein
LKTSQDQIAKIFKKRFGGKEKVTIFAVPKRERRSSNKN